MPDDPTQAKRPDLRELGVSGTRIYSGLVQEESVPQLQGQNAFKAWQGMRNDATGSALLKAIELPIRSARWMVNPSSDEQKDVDLADFVHDVCWDFGDQSFDDICRLALGSLAFGFTPLEILYDYIDDGPWKGKVGWTELAWRSPASKWRWGLEWVGGRRQLVEMIQMAPPSYQQIPIPRNKLLLWVNDREGDNWDGQPCALDTPIPTPTGWTTMGEIEAGDELYDEQGQVRQVLVKSPVFQRKACYEVVFNSGERIVTSGDHKWFARNYQDRKHHKPGRVVTTEEMTRRLRYRRTVGFVGRGPAGLVMAEDGKETNNWSVPAAKPIQGGGTELPLHPYYLGYWLGDGIASTPAYATHKQDEEEVAEQMLACGYDPRPVPYMPDSCMWTVAGRVKGYQGSVQSGLRGLGVLFDKHVPEAYLRAEAEDRLALLQGLMDADGHADTWTGLCVFTNTNERLIGAVEELATSLGSHSVRRRKQEPSKGHDHKGHWIEGQQPTWQVVFSLALPAFRLARKVAGQRRLTSPKPRTDHMIIDIRPVESVPVQCLTTDAPSHLFLVGRHMIPTHNSLLRASWKDFFIRDRLYRIRAIGLERAYMGIPKATIMAGFSDELRDLARRIVETLRVDEQAGVIIPGDQMQLDMLFNHLQEHAMDGAIQYHNRQILLAQLGQFLDLGSGAAGAYSLSSDHSELFLNAINAKANYFAEVLNLDPGIPTLLRFNFPNVERARLPKLEHGDIGQRNLAGLGRTLQALGQWGFLTPDDPTEDRLRQMLDLPEREEAITDRALFDLLQETAPVETEHGRSHGPRPPVPGAPQETGPAVAPEGGGAAPRGGKAASNGGGGANMSEYDARFAENRARLAEVMVRKRWERPKGRPTEEVRMRVRATEKFAEGLEDYYQTVQWQRTHKPPRPSEVVAMRRKPYEVRMAAPLNDGARKLEPGQRRTVLTRQMAIAGQHQKHLADLLRPRPKSGA